MKKIYLALFSLFFVLVSCNMELTPEGEILDEKSLETTDDYEKFCVGISSQMRSLTSGDYVVLSDIQLDDFHAVIGNGNRRMEFYNGSINPSTGEIASYYSAFYNTIAQANFFLQNAETHLSQPSLTPDNKARMRFYVGQVLFYRAYCYYCLADKFCGSYKNAQNVDEEGKGLSLQLTYSPTANNAVYPGRSSLKATYSQICNDLDSALVKLEAVETATGLSDYQPVQPKPNCPYITSDAVKAMQARVFLTMGKDELALKKAEEVLRSGRYSLTERNAFKNLWTSDNGSEVIWLVEADFTYHGSASGEAFASNTSNADFAPTSDCILLFDENDTRWANWFEEITIVNSGGSASSYRFMKYPGNSSLYASTAGSNFVNKAKPLRLSEMYLIAAEASFNTMDESKALNYLNMMMSTRISNYRSKTLTGNALLTAIQDERHRELIGEGLRLGDLKRWNQGFTRGEEWENTGNVIISSNRNLHYDADDYRLTWPIPKHEMDANPQLKGQQNRGY